MDAFEWTCRWGGVLCLGWLKAETWTWEQRKSWECKSLGISKNSWKNFIFKGDMIGRITAEVTKWAMSNSVSGLWEEWLANSTIIYDDSVERIELENTKAQRKMEGPGRLREACRALLSWRLWGGIVGSTSSFRAFSVRGSWYPNGQGSFSVLSCQRLIPTRPADNSALRCISVSWGC